MCLVWALTDDVWMMEALQDLRLLGQSTLVNAVQLASALGVYLLHCPRRGVQLAHPEINEHILDVFRLAQHSTVQRRGMYIVALLCRTHDHSYLKYSTIARLHIIGYVTCDHNNEEKL